MEQLTNYYGFCVNPAQEAWTNKLDYIHAYCHSMAMPIGACNLLGLGLKYCVKRPCPTDNFKKTLILKTTHANYTASSKILQRTKAKSKPPSSTFQASTGRATGSCLTTAGK